MWYIIAPKDYESWQETVYLLSSPGNAQRLLKSLEQANARQVVAKDLTRFRLRPRMNSTAETQRRKENK